MKKKRLLIVGGVAGGASCAARARRLSEDLEIIIFERGPFVSFANCGLPYFVGKVIVNEEKLLVATPKLFKERFNIDVRTQSNVLAIDRENQTITIEDLNAGGSYQERYDYLVLAPGSRPIRPKIPGIDLPGIFTLWTIPDTRDIMDWIQRADVKRALVVGGGFIGLEMTENLKRLGLEVTVVEMARQVMPPFDPEMASFIHEHMKENGVTLRLGHAVSGFEDSGDGSIAVRLSSGDKLETDMVILSVGVAPRTDLAKEAGIEIGSTGGIWVDKTMRTSDPRIYAVGDAVEVTNAITSRPTLTPLAGPANRQGRIAADAIVGGQAQAPSFRGVQATAVCGILGMTAATTGLNERQVKDTGIGYDKIYLHPNDHAAYYPDPQTITMKILFSVPDGRILGAQAVGKAGVEKRIDVISTAIQYKGSVFDLAEAELCYAPQYGSAKDPVNFAGMIADNFLTGLVSVRHWGDLPKSAYVLDVRTREEYKKGSVDGAINIPVDELRSRMDTLPSDREIWAYCYVGLRSYVACRMLSQNGFKVQNLSGGYRMYLAWRGAERELMCS